MKARFVKQTLLGEGSYGRAYLAIDNVSKENVVIKEFVGKRMSTNAKRLAIEECALLSKMNNPNIVAYFGHFMQNGNLSIVMEYANKGDLSGLISKANGKRISEEIVKDIFYQLTKAVAYIHKRNVLHRDIKAGNIFLTSAPDSNFYRVMLADFGVSKVLSNDDALTETLAGTPYYLSPELCNSEPYGKKSDMWALGIVLYELMMLTTPFRGKNLQAVSARITRGKFPEITGPYSEAIKNMCYSLLRNDPKERPSTAQLLDHKMFKGYTELYIAESIRGNKTYISNSTSPASELGNGSSVSCAIREAVSAEVLPSNGCIKPSDPMDSTPTEPYLIEVSPLKIAKKQYHRILCDKVEKDDDNSDYECMNESALHNLVYRNSVLLQLAGYRKQIANEIGNDRFQQYLQKIAASDQTQLTRGAIETIVRQILVHEKEKTIVALVDYVTCYTSFMCFERN
ncbi:Kinase, NEK [Giardia lamblia P15]|uniref:non-specific serine/threonine protein kinase n=1 Tax=Giardia intestinalis (strain P15) TaxID=658858 RepID=E1F6P3_GIAIA|nr:Kinase, NEK [Giardia lamblia P15]